jgi:hypothetical protein
MCTLADSKFRKPKTDTFIAYKVFDGGGGHYAFAQPHNYTGIAAFKIGINNWNKARAERDGYEDQLGFQMFAFKKDALEYAAHLDYVGKVIVQTKNILKIGKSTDKKKAYEVKKFELTKENWENRITVKK